MESQSLKVAYFVEVSAGELEALSHEDDAWHFRFESGLQVVSYSGWNLYEHDYGAKLLLGARDLLQEADPLSRMKAALDGARCEAITLNNVTGATHLQFLRGDDRLSVELLRDSVTSANWRIINGDVEETDMD